jgi:hypothetical protein
MIVINLFRHYLATLLHKGWIMYFILKFCFFLTWRGIIHDWSKFTNKEAFIFAKHLHKLKTATFGTEKYDKLLEEVKPAILHHYSKERHHPEHWKNGVHDMNLLDLVEMLLDWRASCKRHCDGDINKSIDINEKRFKMDHEIAEILHNQIKNDK